MMRWFRKRRPLGEPEPAPVEKPAVRIPTMPEPEAEFYDMEFRQALEGRAPEATIRLLEKHEPTIRLAMQLQVDLAIHQSTDRKVFVLPEDPHFPFTNGWTIIHCDKQ